MTDYCEKDSNGEFVNKIQGKNQIAEVVNSHLDSLCKLKAELESCANSDIGCKQSKSGAISNIQRKIKKTIYDEVSRVTRMMAELKDRNAENDSTWHGIKNLSKVEIDRDIDTLKQYKQTLDVMLNDIDERNPITELGYYIMLVVVVMLSIFAYRKYTS